MKCFRQAVATASVSVVLATWGAASVASETSETNAATQAAAIVVTPPPASTYAGEDLAAYNAVNTARSLCGFGYLRQNLAIDKAVSDHMIWMENNNTFSHFGAPSTPGYDLGSRLRAAGYNYAHAGEVMAQRSGANKDGWGLRSVRNLLAAPYHLLGLLDSSREIGVSVRSAGASGSGAGRFVSTVIDLAASFALPPQMQGPQDVLTYPCQGITRTAYQLTNESPNPIPGRNLLTSPIGQPVFIQVRPGQTLVISTASIVTITGAKPVPLAAALTSASDPNHKLAPHQAIIIPNRPMAPDTQYTVTINGTNDGTQFTRQFTFTTDSQ